MPMDPVQTLCLQRSGEGVMGSGSRVTDSCELPCAFWELNLGPLQRQKVLLTTEQSL